MNKNVKISVYECLADLRAVLSENSLLFFFDNYHFEQKGKKLSEIEPISDVLNPDLPVDVVLHAFDERTAKYHFSKVADIINNPNIYVFILKNHYL